ncbi:response regulator [uncultured Sneathiella sp.]|uniref:response regulator n=1 Tax=uncultured Sneathiella sp. TaxID=879315 RepID=UPI0030EC3992|tara:strand:- start:16578 stop:16955 length:378 start_codon:yes stop_codon:yes gene_type:complete
MTKILYVEDNEDNIYMLSRRLKRKGFEVLTAGDGAAGIEAAKREKPALILMDLSLPKMDGWEATRQLKSSNETKAIPVIALSAHALEGEREKALSAGCDDFDTKPVDFARLMGKIQQYLGGGEGA